MHRYPLFDPKSLMFESVFAMIFLAQTVGEPW
jgi:hypothetical protein